MKKRFAFMVILLAVLCLVCLTQLSTDSQAIEKLDSGKCGENLTWTLTDDGVLTISGNGEMDDYTSDLYGSKGAPWSGRTYHIITVVIEEGVTSIGRYAFYNCFCMTEISIPASVTSIGKDAFLKCTSLNAVHIEDIVAWCRIQFFNESSNPLYYAGELYLDRELVTDVVIPDGTSYIWEYAFYNYEKLTSITIPDSVAFIGKSAFYNCSNIESMTLPFAGESRTSENCYLGYLFGAGDWAENTDYVPESLKTVILSGGCSDIAPCAFYGCTSLTSIVVSEGVTSIGGRAFESCFSLTNICIPDSVTSIGTFAFSSCFNLAYNEYDNSKYLGNSDNPYVALVQVKYTGISSCAIHERTKVICSDAFGYCDNLNSISIPESVISIGDFAFRNCSNLEAVYTTDIAAWCGIEFGDEKSNPLYYAKKLYLNGELVTDLVIPDGVDRIGDYAFDNCSDLTSVIIPDSVTGIGDHAFHNCSKLTDLIIPDSVTSIGSAALSGCSNLESLTIPFVGASYDGNGLSNETHLFGYIFGKERFEGAALSRQYYAVGSVNGPQKSYTEYYIPKSLKTVTLTRERWIPAGAFSGCQSITRIVLGEYVCFIDKWAFSGCFGLTTVTIPSSVSWIEEDAFEDCSNLWHVLCIGSKIEWNYSPEIEKATQHYNCSGDEVIDVDNKICILCCEHELDDAVIVLPTCTEQGYTTGTCTLCGQTAQIDYVDALGHNYDSVVIAPTCTEEGYTAHTCGNCGATYTDSHMDALGHDIVTDAAVAPTCTETGLTEGSYCAVCGEVFVEQTVIEATGHNHTSKVTTAPGCETAGVMTYTCHCGDSYTEQIAATGHDYTDVVTEPTCTEAGYTTHMCENCGTSYADNHVDAMGHSYVDGICEHCGMPEVEPGDVNGDGRVNARDARALLRYLAGLVEENELNLAAADYNSDGRINARDARAILRYIAGLN